MGFDDYRGSRKFELDAVASLVYGIQASGVTYAQLSASSPSGTQSIDSTYEAITQWDDTLSAGAATATIDTSGYITVTETDHYLLMARLVFGGDNDSIYSASVFKDEQQSVDIALLVKKDAGENVHVCGMTVLSISQGEVIDLRIKADAAARFDLITGELIILKISG